MEPTVRTFSGEWMGLQQTLPVCVCMVHHRSAPWLSTESQIESPWTRVCNSLFLKESVPASHTQQHSLVLDLGQSKTYNMLLTGDCFQGKRNTQTESEMKEMIFHANNKKARVGILLSGKIDFKKSTKKYKKSALYNDKGINRRRGYCTP